MNFCDYLNEITIIDQYQYIINNCKPFLDLIKGNIDLFLYRGMKSSNKIFKCNVRKNRKPLNTDIKDHEILNKLFYEKFGWYTRSEGVFCIGDEEATRIYGTHTFVIFPIGNFKFVWSPKVKDMFTTIHNMKYNNKNEIDDWKKLVSSYKDTNLKTAIYSDNEIVIKCEKYYAIRLDKFDNDFRDMFNDRK